ncbi:MAG: hypothetical protein RMY62_003685 [Nostoc sp. ZfuVER08]|uniref:Uncharacterized protein n=1 Tax=Nostoc punctiforme FACHB-252 TaxID=1357509 RepID=A0ABR8H2F9_NOSPU|nr:hypothetical protein [Nostoc punctiforme]MBD2609990.1 hypothetical protein [Nostoc punctiforme FACHB-252]MDZ8015712.1 hypothetical protein [Nostoc sp. ZfuVER08]
MLRPAIINAQTCNQEIFQPGLFATKGVTKPGLAANEPGLIATEPAIIHLNQD